MEKAFTKTTGANNKGSLPNLQPMPPSQPFAVVEHSGAGAVKEKGHHFTPSARLVVTPALRTSGLLAFLPDDALRPLLLLLTFLTPNGDIHPAVCEIAAALQVNERKTRDMMRPLVNVTWKGEPVARELPQRNDGASSSLDRFTLSRHLITHQEVEETDAPHFISRDAEEVRANAAEARRAAVVEHSRAAYGVPRAEAERQVAYQLGHSPRSLQTPRKVGYCATCGVRDCRAIRSSSSSAIIPWRKYGGNLTGCRTAPPSRRCGS